MKKRVLAMIFAFTLITSACSDSKKADNTAQENEGVTEEQPAQVENQGVISGKQEGNISDSTVPETATAKESEITNEKDKENFTTKMSSAEMKEINIFLSNFSEAFYDPSSGYYSPDEAMIDFAFTHASINYDDKTLCEDNYMGISAANVDALLKRFFGRTVPHKTPSGSKHWIYEDGKFLMPAASGESYGNFTIVTEVRVRENGLYEADFNVYKDPEIYGGDIITDKSVYSLVDSQAAEKYELGGYGTAVLKPKKFNGEETYELVSYTVKEY